MNENYYILLNLPIDRFVSGQEAHDALKKQLNIWNASPNTVERNKVEKYKKPVTAAIDDPAVWKAQYEQAKKEVTSALTKWINIVRGKNYITPEEITKISGSLKVGGVKGYRVNEAIVRKMIADKGTPIRSDDAKAANENTSTAKLEDYKSKGDIQFKQPAKAVEQLGCGDFYGFLTQYQVGTKRAFSVDTPADICVRTAKEIELAWKAKKEDAKKSSLQTICVAIIKHFNVPNDHQNQAEYNKFLIYASLKALLDELKSAFKGTNVKILDEKTFSSYVSLIMQQISNRSDAESILENFCKSNEIQISKPVAANGLCPFCNNVFEKPGGKMPETCPVCAHSLLLRCPKCRQERNFAEHRTCGKCGFNFDQYHHLSKQCEDAHSYINTLNFEFAESRISDVETAWPGFPGLAPLRAELNRKKRETGKLVSELNASVNEHRFRAARQQYEKLQKLVPDYSDHALEQQIRQALLEAADLYHAAKSAKDNNTKLQNLIKATEIVTDHAEALQELENIPPEPVRNVCAAAQQDGGCADLTWKSDNAAGTASYRILRKAHSIPVSAEDGKLAQTTELGYCDRTLQPGVPYFYAVLAIRGSRKAELAAVSTPVIIYPRIQEPNVVPDQNSVQVTWQTDIGEMQPEVFRVSKPGAAKYGEGTPIHSVTRNSFSDSGLKAGETYYYNLFLTKKAGGTILISPPCAVTVKPVKIGKPFSCTTEQDGEQIRLEIDRVPEPDEKLMFYTSENSVVLPGSGVVSAANLTTEYKLTPIQVQQESDLVYLFHAVKNAKGYIYPVSRRDETAVVGMGEYFENLEMLEVQSMLSDGVNLHIQLQKWPQDVDQMTVAYRTDRFPSSPKEPGSQKFSVNRTEYTHGQNGIVMPLQPDTCYHIVGFIKGGNGHTAIFRVKYSTEKPMELRYHFNKGAFGHVSLVITAPEEIVLPEMILCAKSLTLPLNSGDGKQLLSIPPGDKKKKFTFSLPPLKDFKKRTAVFGKLFLRDTALYARYRLMIEADHTPKMK